MVASLNRSSAGVSHENLESRLLFASFTVTNLADSGPGSLRAAVIAANSHAGADTIAFDHAVVGTNHTITLTGGAIPITDPLQIVGPGVKRMSVSGNHASRAFSVEGANATISGLRLADGVAAAIPSMDLVGGGALLNVGGTVTLSDMAFEGNFAAGPNAAGGAIANVMGGDLTVERCTFSNNGAAGGLLAAGGAIGNDGDSVAFVRYCTFAGNRATASQAGFGDANGGAIANGGGGSVTLAHSGFAGNFASGGRSGNGLPRGLGRGDGAAGGAVWSGNSGVLGTGYSYLVVDDCSFTANRAAGGTGGIAADGGAGGEASGGAIVIADRGAGTVRNSTFTGNRAIGGGGGDGATDGVGGRGADAAGGAVYLGDASVLMGNNRFDSNSAYGGAGGKGGDNAAGGPGGSARGGAVGETATPASASGAVTYLNVAGCTFLHNRSAGGSGGAAGGMGATGGTGGDAAGGAISDTSGILNGYHLMLAANEAGGGPAGSGGWNGIGGAGGTGRGGAVCATANTDVTVAGVPGGGTASAVVSISDSFVVSNRATGGARAGGYRAGDGLGGGIFNGGACRIQLSGTHVLGNWSMGGAAGVGGVEGVGRGAFYNLGAASCDANAVSSNHASSDSPDRFGAIDII